MDNRILFSTGVFIDSSNNRDHSLIAKMIPKLPVPFFELLVSDYYADCQNEYEAAAQTVLQAIGQGARFPVMHVNQKIGTLISRNEPGDIERALQIFAFNCAYAVRFDVELLVLHLWGGLPSDENIDVNIGVFPQLQAIAAAHNLVLTIENVVCNHHKPLAHMRRLWELYGDAVRFTIDVRHAEFHKSLVETCKSAFLWENNLVRHLHISDYGGAYKDWPKFNGNRTPITFGDVDFEYFFAFLRTICYDGSLTIENRRISESADLVYNFNKAYEFVRGHL